jgi:deoxyinosine 3'endonuclease (endonuclease V)
MKLAVDVYYFENKAKIVGVLFENWEDEIPRNIISFYKDDIADYESGSFYKRELPCIIELLEKIDIKTIETILVDSFVYLDDNKKLGLGGHLYNYLEEKIPVIGVAKTSFHDNKKYAEELFRGESKKPLYISSAGIETGKATEFIKNMHGNFRIPALLKILDQETKK